MDMGCRSLITRFKRSRSIFFFCVISSGRATEKGNWACRFRAFGLPAALDVGSVFSVGRAVLGAEVEEAAAHEGTGTSVALEVEAGVVAGVGAATRSVFCSTY